MGFPQKGSNIRSPFSKEHGIWGFVRGRPFLDTTIWDRATQASASDRLDEGGKVTLIFHVPRVQKIYLSKFEPQRVQVLKK